MAASWEQMHPRMALLTGSFCHFTIAHSLPLLQPPGFMNYLPQGTPNLAACAPLPVKDAHSLPLLQALGLTNYLLLMGIPTPTLLFDPSHLSFDTRPLAGPGLHALPAAGHPPLPAHSPMCHQKHILAPPRRPWAS